MSLSNWSNHRSGPIELAPQGDWAEGLEVQAHFLSPEGFFPERSIIRIASVGRRTIGILKPSIPIPYIHSEQALKEFLRTL